MASALGETSLDGPISGSDDNVKSVRFGNELGLGGMPFSLGSVTRPKLGNSLISSPTLHNYINELRADAQPYTSP